MDYLLKNWPLEGTIDRKKLSYLISQLNGHIEQFLVFEQLNDQAFIYHRLLLQKAESLNLPHVKQKAEQKLKQWMGRQEYRDSQYYRQLFQLHLDNYLSTNPYSREFNPKLQEVSDALDTYYIISRLQFAWEMSHLEAISLDRYQHHLESVLLKWLETHSWGKVPAIYIYRMGLKMLAEPEDTGHYFAFKAGLQFEGRIFPPKERKFLYTGLLNYCVRRSNRYGDLRFLEEYLEVNDLLMSEGLLLEDGIISPWRYVNLKMAALRVDRDDWAWDFIHNYREFLPDDYRDNLFNYALAYVHYHRKAYEKARQILAQVQFEDLLFNVSLRTLLTRVYFEANEIESLLIPQLEANRLFILRHKKELPQNRYQQWHNFNKCCARLAKLDPTAKMDWIGFREQIENTEPLLYKEWLLKQVDEHNKR